MTTPTNWPNPERPGVPLFPERDGLHVIRTPLGTEFLVKWDSVGLRLLNLSGSSVPVERHPKLSYVAPVLTPTQIAEMLAGERERCAKAITEQEIGANESLDFIPIRIAGIIRNLRDAP
ncbi:hypothetical protein ACF3NX_12470 [Acetobacter orientalis]|uniref:hypothetical protein n=1 Tax=Acetobacter orientalis TaxID=146474 RepID=UPI00386EDD83